MDQETLENHLVPIGQWIKAPQRVLERVKFLRLQYGGDLGVGYTDETGWFVLHKQQEDYYLDYRER
jgi:hypothetical protein